MTSDFNPFRLGSQHPSLPIEIVTSPTRKNPAKEGELSQAVVDLAAQATENGGISQKEYQDILKTMRQDGVLTQTEKGFLGHLLAGSQSLNQSGLYRKLAEIRDQTEVIDSFNLLDFDENGDEQIDEQDAFQIMGQAQAIEETHFNLEGGFDLNLEQFQADLLPDPLKPDRETTPMPMNDACQPEECSLPEGFFEKADAEAKAKELAIARGSEPFKSLSGKDLATLPPYRNQSGQMVYPPQVRNQHFGQTVYLFGGYNSPENEHWKQELPGLQAHIQDLRKAGYQVVLDDSGSEKDFKDAVYSPGTAAVYWTSHGSSGYIASSDGKGVELEKLDSAKVSKNLKFLVFQSCNTGGGKDKWSRVFGPGVESVAWPRMTNSLEANEFTSRPDEFESLSSSSHLSNLIDRHLLDLDYTESKEEQLKVNAEALLKQTGLPPAKVNEILILVLQSKDDAFVKKIFAEHFSKCDPVDLFNTLKRDHKDLSLKSAALYPQLLDFLTQGVKVPETAANAEQVSEALSFVIEQVADKKQLAQDICKTFFKQSASPADVKQGASLLALTFHGVYYADIENKVVADSLTVLKQNGHFEQVIAAWGKADFATFSYKTIDKILHEAAQQTPPCYLLPAQLSSLKSETKMKLINLLLASKPDAIEQQYASIIGENLYPKDMQALSGIDHPTGVEKFFTRIHPLSVREFNMLGVAGLGKMSEESQATIFSRVLSEALEQDDWKSVEMIVSKLKELKPSERSQSIQAQLQNMVLNEFPEKYPQVFETN